MDANRIRHKGAHYDAGSSVDTRCLSCERRGMRLLPLSVVLCPCLCMGCHGAASMPDAGTRDAGAEQSPTGLWVGGQVAYGTSATPAPVVTLVKSAAQGSGTFGTLAFDAEGNLWLGAGA